MGGFWLNPPPTVKHVNSGALAVIFLAIAVSVMGAALGGFVIGRRGFGQTQTQDEPTEFPTLAGKVLELFGSVGLLLDRNNQVVKMNKGAATFGLVGKGLLIHAELTDLVRRARLTGKVETFKGNIRIGLRDSKRTVRAKAALVGGDYLVLVLEDQTKEVKADRLRRDFIENISHELKTPIGAISLLAEAIQGSTDDPTALARFTDNLAKESARLAALVQDIIELSRLQNSEVLAEAELVDIPSTLTEAAARNSQLAQSKRVEVMVECPVETKVFGNREMLVTAVKNLIENAITYSDPGSRVGVGCQVGDSIISISVTDSGVGISEANQKRVFERFYRVDPSRSRETGGTGLGLSIVKHVCRTHRGDVSVFSQPGIGSTFTIRLPLAKATDPATGTISIVNEEE